MEQLLYNALIVNEGDMFKGYVEISGSGLIASIGEGTPSRALIDRYADRAMDLGGDWLMPGVIDSHVHFREPGGERQGHHSLGKSCGRGRGGHLVHGDA